MLSLSLFLQKTGTYIVRNRVRNSNGCVRKKKKLKKNKEKKRRKNISNLIYEHTCIRVLSHINSDLLL